MLMVGWRLPRLLSVVPLICLAAPLVLKCRPVIRIYAHHEVCVTVLAVLPCVFSFQLSVHREQLFSL